LKDNAKDVCEKGSQGERKKTARADLDFKHTGKD
jgi:hypothetical protein